MNTVPLLSNRLRIKSNKLSCNHDIVHYVLHRCCLAILFLILLGSFAQAQERLVGLTSKGGALGGGTAFSLLTNNTGFAIHTNFVSGGRYPEGDLTKGTDGLLYGMTTRGGTFNDGTLFKMTTTGSITILKSLDGTTGSSPHGSLIMASDGNFYGMTNQGGTSGYGTIFRMTPGGIVTVIKNMVLGTTGSNAQGSLVQGTDGFLYGMAYYGGSNNQGTIFKLKTDGTSFFVIKHLSSTTGINPRGSLVQGSDGYFYGATTAGGTKSFGTLFKINATGTAFSVIKQLDNTTTGRNSFGRMVQTSAGVFYGMMYQGGSLGNGLIFKITSAGAFTVVKNLVYATTGMNPMGSLIKGLDGFLYGMTNAGGSAGYGTVFRMNTAGTTFTVLKHLDGTTTGSYPKGSLVQSGNAFYGMTNQGGPNAIGTVFKVTAAPSFTVLARFPDGEKGTLPQESLIQAANGYYYGTGQQGGTKGYGTLYRLCTNGSFAVLRHMEYTAHGGNPRGSLIQASDGNFYGMSYLGGTSANGTIFRMTASGTVTVIKNLSSATTGGFPHGSLVQSSDGFLYGMTNTGGTHNYGTIFKIKTDGTQFTVLKHLDNTIFGRNPMGSFIKATDGSLYGMITFGGANNHGVIVKIATTGAVSVVKQLTSTTGSFPHGNLVQGKDGNFYGTTRQGGTSGYGTLFRMNASGTSFTVLKHLAIATTGGYPEGSLVQGSDGAFYGLTAVGGTYNAGTIFKLTAGTSPVYSVMRHLKPATDGSTPLGSLVIQKPNPKANAQSVTTSEDVSKVITLTGTGGTPLSYSITTAPKNGTLSGSGAARTYTPKANYFGKDSFYFTATWGCQTSTSAKVNVTVTSVADLQTVTTTSIMHNSLSNAEIMSSRDGLSITVSPNPSASYFTLVLKSRSNQAVQLKVVDAMGRTIEGRSTIPSNSTLRIGYNYRPGAYIAQMLQDSKVVSVKLIKQMP